jgi:hypothetical protein
MSLSIRRGRCSTPFSTWPGSIPRRSRAEGGTIPRRSLPGLPHAISSQAGGLSQPALWLRGCPAPPQSGVGAIPHRSHLARGLSHAFSVRCEGYPTRFLPGTGAIPCHLQSGVRAIPHRSYLARGLSHAIFSQVWGLSHTVLHLARGLSQAISVRCGGYPTPPSSRRGGYPTPLSQVWGYPTPFFTWHGGCPAPSSARLLAIPRRSLRYHFDEPVWSLPVDTRPRGHGVAHQSGRVCIPRSFRSKDSRVVGSLRSIDPGQVRPSSRSVTLPVPTRSHSGHWRQL